jgi:hypothetical protein
LIEDLRAALKLALPYIEAIKPTRDDPENSEIAAVSRKLRAALRGEPKEGM